MQTSRDVHDLWNAQHRKCDIEPMDLTLDLARYLRTAHGGHGAECRQYLAATAFCMYHDENP